jgi:hypothetical protein
MLLADSQISAFQRHSVNSINVYLALDKLLVNNSMAVRGALQFRN